MPRTGGASQLLTRLKPNHWQFRREKEKADKNGVHFRLARLMSHAAGKTLVSVYLENNVPHVRAEALTLYCLHSERKGNCGLI